MIHYKIFFFKLGYSVFLSSKVWVIVVEVPLPDTSETLFNYLRAE